MKTQDKFGSLHRALAKKYELSESSIKGIRPLAITQGKSKDEIIAIYKERVAKERETLHIIEERVVRYDVTIGFLEHCTAEEFADIVKIPGRFEKKD